MKFYHSKIKKSIQAQRLHRKPGGMKKAPEQGALRLNRLIRENGLQPKLTIGKLNDRYEQEADRVADRVMASPDAAVPVAGGITPLTVQRAEEEEVAQPKKILQRQEEEEEAQPKLLQRQEEEEEAQPKLLQLQPEEEQEEEEAVQPNLQRQEEEEEEMQMKGAGPSAAPAHFSVQLSSLRGSGRPLPASERAFFEPRFGVDFSGVRVHSGGRAAEMSRRVRAKAFTVGQELVFGSGQYAPDSTKGRTLLAHELTHVVQQKGGLTGKLQPLTANNLSEPNGTDRNQRESK